MASPYQHTHRQIWIHTRLVVPLLQPNTSPASTSCFCTTRWARTHHHPRLLVRRTTHWAQAPRHPQLANCFQTTHCARTPRHPEFALLVGLSHWPQAPRHPRLTIFVQHYSRKRSTHTSSLPREVVLGVRNRVPQCSRHVSS